MPLDQLSALKCKILQVAYWLLQHNVSVMMAACDTFRSGAVEQLRTHARRLQVSLDRQMIDFFRVLNQASLLRDDCHPRKRIKTNMNMNMYNFN